MWIGVLGPVVVRVDGSEVDVGPPQQRALLAALALRRGVAATADELVADVWAVPRRTVRWRSRRPM